MKRTNLTRMLCALLVGVLSVSLAACAKAPSEPEMDPVLAQRRNEAEAYMRRMATVLWRAEEDITYTIKSNILPEEDTGKSTRLEIKAGRIYQGLPYSYGAATGTSFLEFAGEPENGVYTISGINWETLSGGRDASRLGNDCSSAVALSWGSIGSTVSVASTQYMTPSNGYVRVGEYTSNDEDNTNSATACANNGEQTMFAAYAQLLKADAVVKRASGSGHAMMVTSNTPVYNEDGTIDGKESKVTILDQTRGHFTGEKFRYDEKLQENVYRIYGIDTTYSYQKLLEQGYLPYTCQAFIDPTPIEEPKVTDSESAFTADNLLTGTISCNWMIDTLTMTITDPAGNTVQEGAIRSTRGENFAVDLQKFVTDNPAGVRGYIRPEELAAGNYHCKLECRLVSGAELSVRDFDFTVS